MNLYPLNLVLAVALASATAFLGYLPARRLTAHFFTRWTLRFGGLWLAVAALTPPGILHYYGLLALVCFIAWWRLHGGHGLGGKIWLGLAAGFGLSLAPVLILAVTPGAWPDAWPAWRQALFLASLYTGGAIPGLAFMLYVFTRREASEAGMNISQFSKWLFPLVLIRACLAIAGLVLVCLDWIQIPIPWYITARTPDSHPITASFPWHLVILGALLPPLARLAVFRINSPRPSAAGPVLLAIAALGFLAQAWALFCSGGL